MLLGVGARSGADARGHARRGHRVHRRATESGRLRCGDRAAARTADARSPAARCSRSSAPRVASARRRRPSTLRRRWRSCAKGPTLLVDLHLAYGDAAVFLGADARFSLLDALENMHRLDAEFLKSLVVKTASGLDLLASADRPANRPVDVRRLGEVVQLAASQYAYTVLDVPRSDLTVLDSLDQVTNLVVVANQELATVRNAGRMAAALRARYPAPGDDGHQPHRPAGRDRPAGRREGGRRRHRASVPE